MDQDQTPHESKRSTINDLATPMRRIGGDWFENTDPTSGNTYYANATTQETRWLWPDHIPRPDLDMDLALDSEGSWEKCTDPLSGQAYYINTATQATQWEKPIDLDTNTCGTSTATATPVELQLRVYTVDGSSVVVPTNAWTTVKDMHTMVTQHFQLLDSTPFAIFESSFLNEEAKESLLDGNDKVFDIVAHWLQTYDAAKAKDPNVRCEQKKGQLYRFLYKVRLFLDHDPEDHAAVNLFYVQAVHDVVHAARYPTSDQDRVTLGALQAQVKYGDWTPAKAKEREKEQEMESRVMHVWKSLCGRGYTTRNAKQNYVEYLKGIFCFNGWQLQCWVFYGSYYFAVGLNGQTSTSGGPTKDFPHEVVLAICAQRVLIVHPQSQKVLANYPYIEVVTWGQSSKLFVLVIGNLACQEKLYFSTEQGNEMASMMDEYVKDIIEKSVEGRGRREARALA